MNHEKETRKIRSQILNLVFNAKEGHLGSSFSIVEILYSFYLTQNTKNVDPLEKNYLIVSKGHAAIAIYVVMQYFKIIKPQDLNNFANFDSNLGGHPDFKKIPEVNASTGSLGHGLPMATGLAYSFEADKRGSKVFVLIGDGELNEGSNWEALTLIANLKLKNLILLVDNNGSTTRNSSYSNLNKILANFFETVTELDGHDILKLKKMFEQDFQKSTAFILNTIKGKGIKIMEGNPEWHHKIPNSDELQIMEKELN